MEKIFKTYCSFLPRVRLCFFLVLKKHTPFNGFSFLMQGFRASLCMPVSWEIFQTVNPVPSKAWLWKATDKINSLEAIQAFFLHFY